MNSNDPWQTRETLLLKIKNRDDESAWEDFEVYYRHYVYNILRHMNIAPVDAEDISQQVLIKMWEKLPEFKTDSSRGKFRSWFATVVRNQAINFLKKKKRHDHQELPSFDLQTSQSDLENIIEKEWQKSIIEKAWAIITSEFEEKTLATFELSSKNMSPSEVAEELQISESTVYSYKSRVKERLKKEIRRLKDVHG